MVDFLAEQRRFREELAKKDPNHDELHLVDAVIALTTAIVDQVDQLDKHRLKLAITSTPPQPETPLEPAVEAAATATIIKKPTPEEHLGIVITELRKGTQTSTIYTKYWQDKFKVDGGRVGLGIEVPFCDWTEEEIERPMMDRWGKPIPGLMLPDLEVITLLILGQMYPQMGSRTVQENNLVRDTHNTRGWIKVYDCVDAPNLNTSRSDAERFLSDAEKEGRWYLPGREKGYVLGSQASKDFNGQYFDQGPTLSWLLGSRVGDGVVYAFFSPRGGLYAGWCWGDPQFPNRGRGWRFGEVKKT